MHSSTSITAATIAALNKDDRLSYAEIGLLLAAFSTLTCSMLLSVIIP